MFLLFATVSNSSTVIRKRSGVLYPTVRAGIDVAKESDLHLHGLFPSIFFCIANFVFFILEESPQILDVPSNEIQTKKAYIPEN